MKGFHTIISSLLITSTAAATPPYYIGEIIPTPKQATYHEQFIPVYDLARQRPLVQVIVGAEQAAQLAGRDLIARICQLAGVAEANFNPLPATANIPDGNIISLGAPSTNRTTASLLKKLRRVLSPPVPADFFRLRGEQGYFIRAARDGERFVCLAGGGGPMGTYFAAMSLIQLLKVEGDQVLLRAATVDDWPTFEMRGTCCYTPEEAAWLALAKFSTLDCNYGSVGINAWRDPDGRKPAGWGSYSGAGTVEVTSCRENPHSGQRCIAVTIASHYKELHGKPDYLSAALMLGDTNGYNGENAIPAKPGKYRLSIWMRGNVPLVKVRITGWTKPSASPSDRTGIPVTPDSVKPGPEWQQFEFAFEIPEGVCTFSPQFALIGARAEGYELGKGFYVDDARLTREGSEENLAPNGDAEQKSHWYSDRIAALWDWAVPRGLLPVQYVNPLYVSRWEDDGELKIQVSDPKQIDDLADTFRISLNRGGKWVMLALDDFSSRLGGPAPWYVITNEADRQAFKSLGECHGTLVKELYRRLKQTHPTVRMLVCPAYYWTPRGAYQEEGEKYLREFGRLVPEDVLIVWTGPNVRSRIITRTDVERFTALIGRKPYLWDNTIYARHREPMYLLEPFDSRYPEEFWNLLTGGLHNNGGVSEIYKVGCLVYGDYAWSPEKYDPEQSLNKALAMVAGEGCVEAAKAFRDHYYAVRDPHIALTGNLTGKKPEELAAQLGPLTQAEIDQILNHIEEMNNALALLRTRSPNKALVEALEQLAQPLRTSAEVLRKYGDLTKYALQKLDNGVRLPEWAFVGGAGHQVYSHHCEPRRATWIYGMRTTTNTMRASFRLDEQPRAATLILLGQNTDKGGETRVEIVINGKQVYAGANRCRSSGWSEWELDLPDGLLQRGENTLLIRNLEDSDSTDAAWFMLSEARLRWR